MERRHRVEVREGVGVSALQVAPETLQGDMAVVYAPGAGSDLQDAFGVFLAAYLEAHGYESWRFQFPYSEAGRRAPDPPALLEATWRAVIDAARQADGRPGAPPRLVVGGRSMGGRIASMAVAKGAPVAGLALFAYPLIPPGRATSGRADHFGSINVPTLFCSGTRDAFGTPERLREGASLVPDATLHFLEGADHGFSVLKASGRRREDVWQEACEALLAFLDGLAVTATGAGP